MSGKRHVEVNAERALRLLAGADVERVRDAVWIGHGGERGIVLLVTPEAFEIRLPTIEWTMGAYDPAESSRLWRRVRAEQITDEQLATVLEQAREARRREYRACRYCGERFPPEQRFERDVCHGCASQHMGVVY